MAKYQPQWPSWRLKPCGTEAAYRRHLRRGEPIDQACREASALEHRFAAAARRARQERAA